MLRTYYASLGAPDLMFKQEAADVVTPEGQIGWPCTPRASIGPAGWAGRGWPAVGVKGQLCGSTVRVVGGRLVRAG